jgi:hypothetical protein
MKKTKLLFALSVGVLAATSFAAHGWNLQKEENGQAFIRCSDGSNAVVAQNSNGKWFVVSAGNKGTTQGTYNIVGQAARAACGE